MDEMDRRNVGNDPTVMGNDVPRTTDDRDVTARPVRDDDPTTLEDRLQAILAVMRSPVDCGRLVDVALTLGMADQVAEQGEESSPDPRQLVANASLAALHASRKGLRWERFTGRDSDETNWHLSLLGELDAAAVGEAPGHER